MSRLLPLILLLVSSATAWAAQPRILLWGIRRGCEYNEDLTRAVQKYIPMVNANVVTLSPKLVRSGCQGRECAALLTQTCPGVRGLLLGGIVEPGKNVSKVRLWLHDLQTGQTAYQDDYCQGCDLTSSVAKKAGFLLDHARFYESAPNATPIYCAAQPPATPYTPPSVRLFVSVTGPHHAAIWPALRQSLQGAGYQVVQVHAEDPSFPLGELRKIAAKDPGSQVLMVEVQSGGKIELNLFDQPTERTEASMVECPGCDKDELLPKLKAGVSMLLSHCFVDDCVRATPMRPPAEACQPFAALRCGGEPVPLVAGGSGAASVSAQDAGTGIDPKLAKLTKGALWGLFAAAAATSVALFAANAAGAGTDQVGNARLSNALTPPAWGFAGMSLLILGVAIPTTILVDRATIATPQTTAPVAMAAKTKGILSLQCPSVLPSPAEMETRP